MKPRARSLLVLLLVLAIAGCAGAGPAGGTAGRPRCASASPDDQRPLFYLFCVESP